MADITVLLAAILAAKKGEEVRGSIHDAIELCYQDGKAGASDLQARQLIEAVAEVNEQQQAALEVLQARVEELEQGEGGSSQQSTTIDIPTVLVDGGVVENVSVNNNGTTTRHITFTTEFTETPKVMVAIGKNVGAVSQYGYLSANILYPTVTTTGFDFFLANRTGSDRSPGVVWYAYQPTVKTIDLDITIPETEGMTEAEVREITGPIAAAVDALKTGYDGTTYQTAAEAVRTQINDLHVLIGDEPGTAISADSIGYEDGSVADALTGLNGRLGEITESGGRNLLYYPTWIPVSASVNYVDDKIIITATSSKTYRTASTHIDIRDTNAVTISWESKESTSTGTYPASIRVGKIVDDSTVWIQYVTTSPTTIDTSEIDTLVFALYVAQGQSEEGDYATFTKLQLEKGSVATEFSQISKIAVDRVAREEIGKLQERIFPTVPIVDASLKVLNDTNLWEAGSISPSEGENTVQSKSVRLKGFMEVDPSRKLYFQAYYVLPDSRVEASGTDNAHLKNPYVYQYREDFSFISRISPSAASILTGSELALDGACKYVRFAFYTDINNSDISTIMPSTIYADAVGGDMWLPPYYESYLSEKADVITHFMRNEVYNTTSRKYEKIYDPDANLISFIFITDNHYTDPARTTKYNQMHSPAVIKRLAEKVNIPMVFDGGDVDHSGLWTNLFTVPLSQAFDGPIYYAVGNHEFLSRNTGTNLYYDMDSLNSNQIGSADHHYYYVDNSQLKLRILVLASNMESQAAMGTGSGEASQVGYTTEQEIWVNDVALATLPSGWNIIAFTHFFYGVNADTGSPSLSHGSTILAALANNPAVIAVFQGHTHFDRIVKGHDSVAGTLPIIITSCDKNIPHTSESVYPVNRSTGTVFEQLMDVVVINRSTRTINLIRVGGKALDGINDNIGSETEIRTVTYGD